MCVAETLRGSAARMRGSPAPVAIELHKDGIPLTAIGFGSQTWIVEPGICAREEGVAQNFYRATKNPIRQMPDRGF